MRNKIIFIVLMGLAACHSNPPAQPPADNGAMKAIKAADSAKNALKGLAYAYKKDPSCGMPLTAGVEDTTTYKGKLYGFCSQECKDAFLKDPEAAIAQIKAQAKDTTAKN